MLLTKKKYYIEIIITLNAYGEKPEGCKCSGFGDFQLTPLSKDSC